jgi:5-methylcytosine-specific restriction endonuclease McrA
MIEESNRKAKRFVAIFDDGQHVHFGSKNSSTFIDHGDKQKREAYERQKGICPVCTEHYEIEEMEGDHITPWHLGGKTTSDNCQMLCKDDNRRKSGK